MGKLKLQLEHLTNIRGGDMLLSGPFYISFWVVAMCVEKNKCQIPLKPRFPWVILLYHNSSKLFLFFIGTNAKKIVF